MLCIFKRVPVLNYFQVLASWIFRCRDATGGKFPLNSRGKFRCCFCQLFEILVRLELPLDFHAWSRISNFAESTVRLLNLIRRARIMHVVWKLTRLFPHKLHSATCSSQTANCRSPPSGQIFWKFFAQSSFPQAPIACSIISCKPFVACPTIFKE